MQKIIFVHGFGVKKDARGIFTDIQKSFAEDKNFENIKFIFTDLNIIQKNGDLILNTLENQAEIMQKVYDREKENSEIYIVAHSQGCVVATLCNLESLKKTFFLAPPTNNDLQKSIDRMKQRSGTIINLETDSIVERADGSKTIIPASYWKSREKLFYLDCYKNFSEKVGKENLEIILAKQDEIVSNDKILELEKMGDVIEIDGDHNFKNNRLRLAEIIREEI